MHTTRSQQAEQKQEPRGNHSAPERQNSSNRKLKQNVVAGEKVHATVSHARNTGPQKQGQAHPTSTQH